MSTSTYFKNKEELSNIDLGDSLDEYKTAIRNICNMFVLAKRNMISRCSNVIDLKSRFKLVTNKEEEQH